MDDLISRQDAVEATRCLQTYKLFESDDMLLVDLADVQTTLMMLRSEQQWIPCSERLPEEDGTYFVSGVWENGDVEVGQLQYIADEHRFSNVIYFNVDAWMPLPSPYREEVSD